MQHTYLISYSYIPGPNALAFSHQDITLPVPLQTKHLPAVVSKISEIAGHPVAITNIYKFEPPAASASVLHVHRASCDGTIGEKLCGHP